MSTFVNNVYTLAPGNQLPQHLRTRVVNHLSKTHNCNCYLHWKKMFLPVSVLSGLSVRLYTVYGLEACIHKHQIASLDFVVNRFFMKLSISFWWRCGSRSWSTVPGLGSLSRSRNFLKGFFIYYCDSYRHPRWKSSAVVWTLCRVLLVKQTGPII